MMIVIDDAAGMTKYIWDYLDIIVIGGKMDIVDDLRKDAYGERQSIREARMELGGLLEDAANEIERLRGMLISALDGLDEYWVTFPEGVELVNQIKALQLKEKE
jgi:hypothetical protein